MITLEKVMFLRQVPLFERIPSAELVRLAEVTEEMVVPRGGVVFREGDFGEELFVIADGRVRIVLNGRTLATLDKSDYFGEMSLLDGEPRSAGAEADTDVLLLRISQKDFHQILRRHFDASLAVIRTLSQRLRTELNKGRSTELEDAV
jgi:CRP/FNR family transcriptional regulator, cyclic AMP receptor protein